jgi:putative membrane protein
MSAKQKEFFLRWLNTTAGVVVATYLVHGLHYEKFLDLLVASLLLGILNAFVRPVVMFFSLPLVFMTLGLFIFVINAALLYFVGWIMKPHFRVESFGAAFWGGIDITLVAFFLNLLIGVSRAKVQVRRAPPPRDPDDGNGPVIDI